MTAIKRRTGFNPFVMMIVTHIILVLLYLPGTRAGYDKNIVFTLFCAALTCYEVHYCRTDTKHEIFWIIFLLLNAAAIFVMVNASLNTDYIAPWWQYILLFLGMPAILTVDLIYHFIPLLWVMAILSAGVIAALLVITVRRLYEKKAVR